MHRHVARRLPWTLGLLVLAGAVQAGSLPEPQAVDLGTHQVGLELAAQPPAETVRIHLPRGAVDLQPSPLQRLAAEDRSRSAQGADLFQMNLDQAPGQVEFLPSLTKGVLPFLRCNTHSSLVTCLQTPLALKPTTP